MRKKRGKKRPHPRPFSTDAPAVKRFIEDVQDLSIRVYSVEQLPSGLPNIFPPSLIQKCSQVDVAVSGCVETGRSWMVICPRRVDGDSFDIDPAILVFDSLSMDPSPSGLVGYHQDFQGRTEPICADTLSSGVRHTVKSLREAVEPKAVPLEAAPKSVLNALRHMAEALQKYPNFPPPPNSNPPELKDENQSSRAS